MMNETGSYPGQAWLWLYTVLVPDPAVHDRLGRQRRRLVWGLMMLLSLGARPGAVHPGIRSIPAGSRSTG